MLGSGHSAWPAQPWVTGGLSQPLRHPGPAGPRPCKGEVLRPPAILQAPDLRTLSLHHRLCMQTPGVCFLRVTAPRCWPPRFSRGLRPETSHPATRA